MHQIRRLYAYLVWSGIVMALLMGCRSEGNVSHVDTPSAQDKDLLLTPPVPGIAFPRQKLAEGARVCMEAALAGTLRLEGGCLSVQSPGSGNLLPIWPPEFTLRVEGDRVLVIDGEGQVAARAGDEVYMGGGYIEVFDEWVLQQIPPACREEYFIVGCEVRPNLQYDSALFALDGAGQVVARMGDEVSLRGRAIPHDADVAVYRRLIDELPGDCIGASWLVDGDD